MLTTITTIASLQFEICADPELPLQKHSLVSRSRKGEEREGRGGKSGREQGEGGEERSRQQFSAVRNN